VHSDRLINQPTDKLIEQPIQAINQLHINYCNVISDQWNSVN